MSALKKINESIYSVPLVFNPSTSQKVYRKRFGWPEGVVKQADGAFYFAESEGHWNEWRKTRYDLIKKQGEAERKANDERVKVGLLAAVEGTKGKPNYFVIVLMAAAIVGIIAGIKTLFTKKGKK